jgi:hypothetical protein
MISWGEYAMPPKTWGIVKNIAIKMKNSWNSYD